MGGNVSVNGLSPQPICFRNNPGATFEQIEDTLHEICYVYEIMTHERLTKELLPFSGSTKIIADCLESQSGLTFIERCKPEIGDIDVQVYDYAKDNLHDVLDGFEDLIYKVVGLKKHGDELTALMLNKELQQVHQFDFQFESLPGSDLALWRHSSPIADTIAGFKGAFHKILLNAIGGEEYKFSITHGLRRRDDDAVVAFSDYSNVLFPEYAVRDRSITRCLDSFIGLVELIKAHKDDRQKLAIFDKFQAHTSRLKHLDSTKAVEYLRNASNA